MCVCVCVTVLIEVCMHVFVCMCMCDYTVIDFTSRFVLYLFCVIYLLFLPLSLYPSSLVWEVRLKSDCDVINMPRTS